MLARQPCHKHHCKHMHDSPAAAAAVGTRQKPGGGRKRTCKGHTGRAMFSKRSNKEACNMKAQGHAAHTSMQDGVAGAAWYCGSVQACLTTLLYKHIADYALAKRCLVGARHVITQLAYSKDSQTSPCCCGSSGCRNLVHGTSKMSCRRVCSNCWHAPQVAAACYHANNACNSNAHLVLLW
jgi:hypothetical protein